MQKKTLGIVLMFLGLVVLIASLAADALGIGMDPGIGWKQALGALVGVIVAGVGAWYWPGFPQSRMMAEAAAPMPMASPTPKKAAASKTPRKSRAAKKASRPARKASSRGARRGRKR